MRRLTLAAVLAVLAVTPHAQAADGTTVVSDPSLGAMCAGAGAAHTTDVTARGRQVVATWTVGADAAIGVASSDDAGRTWSHSLTRFTTCSGGSLVGVVDPDVAIGADGTPWVSASGDLPRQPGVSTGDAESRTLVQVGSAAPVSVFPGVAAERGFLETHPTDPSVAWVLGESVTRGSLTAGPVSGAEFFPGGPEGRLLLGRTTDRGRSWQVSTLRTPLPGAGLIALGLVRTGSTLVALSVEYDFKDPVAVQTFAANGSPRATISAQTSKDGGATWSVPAVVGTADQATLVDVAAGDDLVSVVAPQFDGSLRVWTSDDGARTWRQTIAATGVANPAAAVSVDASDRIQVLSYAASGNALRPQVSTSSDSGRTFGRPRPLALPFDGKTIASGSHVHPTGPYHGAASVGRRSLMGFVADDDHDGRLEARVAEVD